MQSFACAKTFSALKYACPVVHVGAYPVISALLILFACESLCLCVCGFMHFLCLIVNVCLCSSFHKNAGLIGFWKI